MGETTELLHKLLDAESFADKSHRLSNQEVNLEIVKKMDGHVYGDRQPPAVEDDAEIFFDYEDRVYNTPITHTFRPGGIWYLSYAPFNFRMSISEMVQDVRIEYFQLPWAGTGVAFDFSAFYCVAFQNTNPPANDDDAVKSTNVVHNINNEETAEEIWITGTIFAKWINNHPWDRSWDGDAYEEQLKKWIKEKLFTYNDKIFGVSQAGFYWRQPWTLGDLQITDNDWLWTEISLCDAARQNCGGPLPIDQVEPGDGDTSVMDFVEYLYKTVGKSAANAGHNVPDGTNVRTVRIKVVKQWGYSLASMLRFQVYAGDNAYFVCKLLRASFGFDLPRPKLEYGT